MGLKLFLKLMSNLSETVSFEEVKSKEEQGAPQTTILGPLLFLIRENDLIWQIEKSNVIIYMQLTLFFASRQMKCLGERQRQAY